MKIALQKAKERAEKLRAEIDKHRYLYHVLDKPEISDEVYDSLMRELKELEEKYPELKTADSPSQRIGGAPLEKFEKTRHAVKQWSLDDAFTAEEVKDWEERNSKILMKAAKTSNAERQIQNINYCVEIKIDGLKIILTYEKGLLVKAATRGDGLIGEKVTEQVKTIHSLPLKLNAPLDIVVVGEAWMPKDELERINQERKKQNLPLFANSRNAAAGSIRQLDPKITASRKLDLYVYDIDNLKIPDSESQNSKAPETQIEELQLLKNLGFKINSNYEFCRNLKEVQEFFNSWEHKRNAQIYGIDGVVIKVNSNRLQKILGYTGKSPRWALAWKFTPEKATTVVEDVNFQVGRTGVLTPVARLKPVKIAGSVVSRATLHNEDEINRLDVRIGDTIVIHKAGDVIPEVVEVLKNLRNGKEKKIRLPAKCPICGGPVKKEILKETRPSSIRKTSKKQNSEFSVAHYCLNKKCFAVEKEKIIHFVSKKGFNIEGMGEKIVEQLMNEGLIFSAADIFKLTTGDLELLDRFAEKSARNLTKALEKSKEIEFPKFLYALGIRHVGEETAALVAHNLKSVSQKNIKNLKDIIDYFPLIKLEDWLKIKGLGEKSSKSLVSWFNYKNNIEMLEKMQESGVKVLFSELSTGQSGGQLQNLNFVLTGEMENFTREEAKYMIRKAGGRVSSSVSKNTDYVIAGKSPGTKYEKAKNLGIKIIDEEEFKKMIKI